MIYVQQEEGSYSALSVLLNEKYDQYSSAMCGGIYLSFSSLPSLSPLHPNTATKGNNLFVYTTSLGYRKQIF